MRGTTEIQNIKFNWNFTNSIFRKWSERASARSFTRIMSGQINYSEACDLFILAVENAEQETTEGKKVKYSYSIIEDMLDDFNIVPIKEISLAVAEMINKSFALDEGSVEDKKNDSKKKEK